MANTNPPANAENWLEQPSAKIPSMLNVLTILTFIANGLGFIWAFVSYARAQTNYETVVNAQDKLDQAPDWARKLAGPHPVETARAMLDNRFPILIITLITAALCFFGALQMRQLKKTGFSLYILGDIVSFATGIFIGFDTFATFGAIIALVFIIVFVILYATQLKYLK